VVLSPFIAGSWGCPSQKEDNRVTGFAKDEFLTTKIEPDALFGV
jgi:hypothetical protein